MPCMCPLILLLFCTCVHRMPCLALYPPYHNSKIPLLKSGYITSNYLIIQKNPVYIPTMEIRYCLIQSPFHYGTSYLNDNLNYTPCNHKLDNLFGTVTRAARKSTLEIKLSIPVNQSGTRCFDYTLQVPPILSTWSSTTTSTTSSFEQLCWTYQNHVL